MIKKYIALGFSIIGSTVTAGTLDCGHLTIENLYVQGDRSDNSFHENKMLIILGSDKKVACGDTTFAYLDIDDPAFNGTLSMALSAYMAGKKIRIVLNDGPLNSDARRIEWINF